CALSLTMGSFPRPPPSDSTPYPLCTGALVRVPSSTGEPFTSQTSWAVAEEYPESRQRALQTGYRTALAVPLVHAGEAIGVIFRAQTYPQRPVHLIVGFPAGGGTDAVARLIGGIIDRVGH